MAFEALPLIKDPQQLRLRGITERRKVFKRSAVAELLQANGVIRERHKQRILQDQQRAVGLQQATVEDGDHALAGETRRPGARKLFREVGCGSGKEVAFASTGGAEDEELRGGVSVEARATQRSDAGAAAGALRWVALRDELHDEAAQLVVVHAPHEGEAAVVCGETRVGGVDHGQRELHPLQPRQWVLSLHVLSQPLHAGYHALWHHLRLLHHCSIPHLFLFVSFLCPSLLLYVTVAD